jgi:hypothetical protein
MEGMKRRDARALDHKTLQEIRIRAVERVQAGESPEAVIQALGFTRSCIYTWREIPQRGLGCAEGPGPEGSADEDQGHTDAVALS